jgi:Family of unknown function (DUF6325)
MSADVQQAPGADSAAADTMGPVDYLVVAFSTDRMTGEAFGLLVDLVDRGIIRILDLAFVRKDAEGTVTTLTQVDLDRMQVLNTAIFDGAASGLLGADDLAEAATAMDPGTAAAVLVYENVWATPFATALRRAGGQLVGAGHIPVQALLAALDEVEAADAAPSATPAARSSAESSPAQQVG